MNERGFTLAELLIAMAVLAMILGGVFVVQQAGQTAYVMGAARVEAQQNARIALARIVRELRSGTAVTTATNCNTTAGATSITFTFIDDTQTEVTVQYGLTGGTLQRNQTAPAAATAQPETLIAGVDELQIWCYASDGSLTATATNVRSVRISLKVHPDETTSAMTSGTFQQALIESTVRMRNVL